MLIIPSRLIKTAQKILDTEKMQALMNDAYKAQMTPEDILVHSANVVIGTYNCICGERNLVIRLRDFEIGTLRCSRCNTLHSVKPHEMIEPTFVYDSLTREFDKFEQKWIQQTSAYTEGNDNF